MPLRSSAENPRTKQPVMAASSWQPNKCELTSKLNFINCDWIETVTGHFSVKVDLTQLRKNHRLCNRQLN